MTHERAPYYAELADGPDHGEAYWLTASDGVRIRVGLWPHEGAKGTVFILPGRTECIEKYGRGAADLAARGFASLAIDWRGQGIAERLLKDRRIGHVEDFADYQKDLDAVIALVENLAEEKAMPKPWFLIGHSMGGAIGVRALIEGKPFKAAGFSAPMWGIGLSPIQKLLVRFVSPVFHALGLQNLRAPGTKPESYMVWHGFKDNLLTSDREMFDYMTRQVVEKPDLSLGGPSSHWVTEAIAENDWAFDHQMPDVPVLCFLGLDEKIVNTQAVRDFAARWRSCELIEVAGGRHEIPMESPAIRKHFYDHLAALFSEQCT
ncbi:alpha/beta fold hydrolase [Celeribacter sp. SCSIO 80788]|uniref:alpha/beta fold hydrolase n=1 Tax=Celeribacter sp. SCSIO 80788 TaxID=3117013 RepID=UPI003DA3C869